MFARPALFCLLLAAPAGAASTDAAAAKAAELRLWEDPRWLRLGHWKKSWRGLASDAENAGFFLHPRGRVDPRAELETFLRALHEDGPGPDPQPARCRFPARAAFVLEALALDSLPPSDCSRYEEWRRLMDPASVSLIFASAYLNNPASMFGHTFVRLERGRIGKDRLLDNTLNFAAETGDDGGALFAVKGLSGLYPGKYTAQPYYMMVQQYNNIESRDLWEYRLAMSAEEVETLARHAWEMGQANFPYYFLSKNCSYQLMPALEAAMPGRTLMPGSPLVVAPVDTVEAALASPGLVASVHYRPSHSTTMRARRALLTRPERRAADAYRFGQAEEGDRLSEGMPEERRALILDAAQDYVLYKEGYSPDVPEAVRERERLILLRRAKLDAPAIEPSPASWAAPPNAGHRRRRLALGAGARSGAGFAELSWRPGYHDLLDRQTGFVPGASIESFSWRLRYDGGEKKLYLRDLRVIEVLSTAPWDPWMKKPSWTVGMGLDTAFEKGRAASDSLVYEGHAGTGLAFEPAAGAGAWAMAVGEAAAGAVLREGWRIGGSLKLGASADLGTDWRAVVEGGLSAQVWGDKAPNHRVRAALNWSPERARAVRAEILRRGPHTEGGLYASYYY